MELGGFFHALYDRFVLRDLFAKIVPGLVALAALAVAFDSGPFALGLARETGVFGWLALYGIAWLAGLALQGLGEACGWIRYYPERDPATDKPLEDEDFYRLQSAFDAAVEQKKANASRIERLVVIKEACGNGALALAWAVLLVGGKILLTAAGAGQLRYLPGGFAVAAVFYGLRRMHVVHRRRQFLKMTVEVERAGPKRRPRTRPPKA